MQSKKDQTNQKNVLLPLKKKLDTIYPGLWETIEKKILTNEAEFCQAQVIEPTTFLWSHSQEVAAIAAQLAEMEKQKVDLAILTGLLHDAGKFHGGVYHRTGLTEEEGAVTAAKELLVNLRSEDLTDVLSGLGSIYIEDKKKNFLACLVHDADRLEKLGHWGVANFFLKAGIRQINSISYLRQNLSKELTYIMNAPQAMLTKAGKTFAQLLSKQSYRFFEGLLNELSQWDIAKYNLEKKYLPELSEEWKNFPVTLVLIRPEQCEQCASAEFTLDVSIEPDIKCKKLKARYICSSCAEVTEYTFCVPEIHGEKKS